MPLSSKKVDKRDKNQDYTEMYFPHLPAIQSTKTHHTRCKHDLREKTLNHFPLRN